MATTTETRTEKGISLARGPALILGTIVLAAGLYFLYKAHTFPKFSSFPNGTAHRDGTFFLGLFGANGWTGEFTAVAGGLLLFGAAQHLLAKTMSLIVGLAFGAAAVIALSSGDVLGMAAANGWTELGWGVVAAILLFNTLIPRRRRTVTTAAGEPVGTPVRRERAVAPAGDETVAERERGREAAPVAERTQAAPVAERPQDPPAAPVAEPTQDPQAAPVAERGQDSAATRPAEPVGPTHEPVAPRNPAA